MFNLKNGIVFSIALMLMATPLAAIEYKYVSKGQIYDLDLQFQFTNPRAKVLDKSNGKVLVQILEGDRKGEVDWVYPSKLLAKSDSQQQETENIVGGLAVGAAILCQMSETCRNNREAANAKNKRPPAQKLAARSSLVSQPEGADRTVRVKNECAKPIKLALAYSRDGRLLGQDVTWTIKGKKSARLNERSGVLLKADASTLYYHAKSQDGKLVWRGKTKINLEGKNELNMRSYKAKIQDGSYTIRVTC